MGVKGQVIVWSLVCGLLLSVLIIFPTPSSASPFTVVTLNLQGEPPKVDVSPGSSGIVEVDGNVTCLKYGPDQVKVSLTSSSDISGASCEPPNFVFDGISGSEETQPFKISTRIPQGTTSSATPQVTVSGNYIQGGLVSNINPVSTIIEIIPYCKIEAKVSDSDLDVNAGGEVGVELRIVNVGNCDDSYEIDINNKDNLRDRGFNFPGAMEITLPEKENETINWRIGTDQDMSGGYFMEFKVISKTTENDDSPVYAITSFRINVIKQSITEQIGSYFLSPIAIILSIIVIISALVYKKRKNG